MRALWVGLSITLSVKGTSNRVDRSTYFFPKDTQYVSILGNWNIYSNNSISLDLTKSYDM